MLWLTDAQRQGCQRGIGLDARNQRSEFFKGIGMQRIDPFVHSV